MLKAGDYAWELRTVGQLLDAEGARTLEIRDRGPALEVRWQTPQGGCEERVLSSADLLGLRQEAASHRELAREQFLSRRDFGPASEWADLLRTLGQELDAEQAEVYKIELQDDAFAVLAIVGGQHLRRRYGHESLRRVSERNRAQRSE